MSDDLFGSGLGEVVVDDNSRDVFAGEGTSDADAAACRARLDHLRALRWPALRKLLLLSEWQRTGDLALRLVAEESRARLVNFRNDGTLPWPGSALPHTSKELNDDIELLESVIAELSPPAPSSEVDDMLTELAADLPS